MALMFFAVAFFAAAFAAGAGPALPGTYPYHAAG
ncbi:hypothetical protein J2S98_002034 [Arthrobacter oryzae]|nr:hypothetical protein [Arthrobacter oryzae]